MVYLINHIVLRRARTEDCDGSPPPYSRMRVAAMSSSCEGVA